MWKADSGSMGQMANRFCPELRAPMPRGSISYNPERHGGLGVNPNDPLQNILGGVGYLKQLLDRFGGNQELALEHYYGSKDTIKNQGYAAKVMGKEASEYHYQINITVPQTSATAQDIGREVMKVLHENTQQQTQRNITEFATPSWSYE